jgi:hypothetical protein
MTPEDLKNKLVSKIMDLIPDVDDFKRIMDLNPDAFDIDIGPKPVFPYSQEDVENMTKSEYREAFVKWEYERYDVWEDNKYYEFHDYNNDLLDDMELNELMDLFHICKRIKSCKMSFMDIKSDVPFKPKGLYFDKNKELVIYNGR